MRKIRFTAAQMMSILRDAERNSVAVASTAHEISEQTIYGGRKRFGAMEADEMRRLRQLEQENARLKTRAVERDRKIEVMKEIAVKKWGAHPHAARRWPIPGRELSARRACTLLRVARSTLSYAPRLPAKEVPVSGAVRSLTAQYPWSGYRRLQTPCCAEPCVRRWV